MDFWKPSHLPGARIDAGGCPWRSLCLLSVLRCPEHLVGSEDVAGSDLAPLLLQTPARTTTASTARCARWMTTTRPCVCVPGPLQLPRHHRRLREGEGSSCWVAQGREGPTWALPDGDRVRVAGEEGAIACPRKQVKHLVWRLSLPLTQHLPFLCRSVALTTRPMTPPAISLPPSAPWREPRRDTSCTWTTLGLANVSGAKPSDNRTPNWAQPPCSQSEGEQRSWQARG